MKKSKSQIAFSKARRENPEFEDFSYVWSAGYKAGLAGEDTSETMADHMKRKLQTRRGGYRTVEDIVHAGWRAGIATRGARQDAAANAREAKLKKKIEDTKRYAKLLFGEVKP